MLYGVSSSLVNGGNKIKLTFKDTVDSTSINNIALYKADGTEVYCKQWLQNGTTRILTFKPVLEDNTNNLSSDTEKLKISISDEVTDVFMKRFDVIESKISQFEQSLTKSLNKASTSRTKKEADAE